MKLSRAWRLLIIDDDASVRSVLESRFARKGFEIALASSGDEALKLLKTFEPDAALTDIRMPGLDGFEVLKQITVPTILMTGHGDKESAIKAVEAGAFAFFEKPFDLDALEVAARRAAERSELLKERAALLEKLDRLCRLQGRELENYARQAQDRAQFIGKCAKILEIHETLERLARKPVASLLILGETGTGKEVTARELHQLTHGDSANSAPFVALNCSAIPPDLFESELYGHEKGSFSGATATRVGLAEAARDGTLFLDEIGDMDAKHQTKLLRLIQEKKFRRVGSISEINFTGRIVAATHRDLSSKDSRFREDLFYRLSVVSVTLPPLRERGADVLLLAEALCKRYGLKGVAPERVPDLAQHRWPGNIRELNNWIERASILGEHDSSSLVSSQIPGQRETATHHEAPYDGSTAASTLDEIARSNWEAMSSGQKSIKDLRDELLENLDRSLISQALDRHEFNISAAAKSLGLDRKNLARRMKELGLDPRKVA